MDKAEIQSIVIMTVQELKRQGLLKDTYGVILREFEPVIREYFTKKKSKNIEKVLHSYSDDPYIDIIYLHYRDSLTLEKIAHVMDRDISTIKRNKKRLILGMYELMEE